MSEKETSVGATLRSRWAELAITLAVSVITSALVMSWTLSAQLAEFKTTITVQGQRLDRIELTVAQNTSVNGSQTAQIAVQSTQWTEVIRRLDAIDRKLEHR